MEREQLLKINQQAWNAQVERKNRWTVPVSTDAIEKARSGKPEIVLTPNKVVPQSWFPSLNGCETLMLASGGGQQTPIMAAAGAKVTVVDLSEKQLEQDRHVADREGLEIRTVQASMDDLSGLEDDSFDLVIQPCSNCFAPDLAPVWAEIARVSRPNAILMVGFCSPLIYMFDERLPESGKLEVRYSLPYSDLECLNSERLQELRDEEEPFMFGHTLTQQIGGQLRAGFHVTEMFEDTWRPVGVDGVAVDAAQNWSEVEAMHSLDRYISSFIATRSCLAART